MNAYLPALAFLGLWLLLGASVALLRRVLAGPSAKPRSTAGPDGPEIESDSSAQPLALLGPALSGAVLLLALGAGLAPPGAGGLPILLLILVLAIALIHAARWGDAPPPP